MPAEALQRLLLLADRMIQLSLHLLQQLADPRHLMMLLHWISAVLYRDGA